MFSAGGSRSVVAGSDELHVCDPCKSEGRQREAEYHCQQCREFLCNRCKDQHKRFKLSRDLKVIKISSVEETRSVIGASNELHKCGPCKSDGNSQEANHYCEQCKEYLCSSCLLQHKRFKVSKDHKIWSTTTPDTSPVPTSKQIPVSDTFSMLSMATALSNTDQLDNMLKLKAKSSIKVNIKLPQDEETPRISSCAFLPNGELLLVDHNNSSLKLLGRTLTVKNSFDLLPDIPWDVSVLGTNTVVVTFPLEKKLEFIQVSPSFSRSTSVQFHKECLGVAVAVDTIYVTCHDNDGKKKVEDFTPGEICVLDIVGTR